jgi:hypothetical protein
MLPQPRKLAKFSITGFVSLAIPVGLSHYCIIGGSTGKSNWLHLFLIIE